MHINRTLWERKFSVISSSTSVAIADYIALSCSLPSGASSYLLKFPTTRSSAPMGLGNNPPHASVARPSPAGSWWRSGRAVGGPPPRITATLFKRVSRPRGGGSERLTQQHERLRTPAHKTRQWYFSTAVAPGQHSPGQSCATPTRGHYCGHFGCCRSQHLQPPLFCLPPLPSPVAPL